jgi:hypothetical protein
MSMLFKIFVIIWDAIFIFVRDTIEFSHLHNHHPMLVMWYDVFTVGISLLMFIINIVVAVEQGNERVEKDN